MVPAYCEGKDLCRRRVLSLEWMATGVTDGDSGENENRAW